MGFGTNLNQRQRTTGVDKLLTREGAVPTSPTVRYRYHTRRQFPRRGNMFTNNREDGQDPDEIEQESVQPQPRDRRGEYVQGKHNT